MLEPLIQSPADVVQRALDRAQRVGRHWVWADGTVRPVIAGGSGEDPGGNPPPADPTPPAGDPPPADPPKPPEAKLTQADIVRAKADAKKAAIAEVAETLGCTVEEAKALVEAKRANDDAQKTEAQRAREAADAEKVAAESEKRAAASERRQLRTERALLAARVNDKRLEKAARLILAELGDDADEAAVATAVETFKKDTPEWFGAVAGAPGSDPGGRGPGGGGGNDGKTGMDAGRARAVAEAEARKTKFSSPFEGYTVVGGNPGGSQ